MKICLFLTGIISAIIFSFPLHAAENKDSYHPEIARFEVDTPPVLIKSVMPAYPIYLRIYAIEGKVVVRFIVTKEGNIEEPEVRESIPTGAFDEAALKAIKQYEFKPATKNGEPVDCIVNVPFEFSLRELRTGKGKITRYDAYKALYEGIKYIDTGEYDHAIEAFTKSIEIYNQYSAAYFARGSTYLEIGEYQKALSDLNKAIKLKSDIADYYNQRGIFYIMLENYEKAINDLNKAIKLDKDMIDAYYNRGNAFMKSGRFQEAIEDYTKVISAGIEDAQVYNNRGYCYNKLNDMENTCVDLKKACEFGDCRGMEILKKAGKCSDMAANPEYTENAEERPSNNIIN